MTISDFFFNLLFSIPTLPTFSPPFFVAKILRGTDERSRTVTRNKKFETNVFLEAFLARLSVSEKI